MQDILKKEVILLTPLAGSFVRQQEGDVLRTGAMPPLAGRIVEHTWWLLQLPKYHVKVGHRDAEVSTPLTYEINLEAASYHRTRRYQLVNFFEMLMISQVAEQVALTQLYRQIHEKKNINFTVIDFAERLGLDEDEWDVDSVIRTYNNHKKSNHPLIQLAKQL